MPDFIIIGAMKCGTSTLHAQLAALPGVFMTTPKEPNFFSDDEMFVRGLEWYRELFKPAGATDLKGEASTHYTKRPTHSHACERMFAAAPHVKLIYMMRHPIDRLVSHYIHEWTMGAAPASIDDAAAPGTPFVDYGRYAYQLEPYLEKFGKARVLPVFLERLNSAPNEELRRIVRFLGRRGGASWREDLGDRNISMDRIRRFPLYAVLVESAPARVLRRTFVPRSLRNRVKARLQMRDRPKLSLERRHELNGIFDDDLARLGALLGTDLNCANFKDKVIAGSHDWKA